MNIKRKFVDDEVQNVLSYTWKEFDRDVENACRGLRYHLDESTDGTDALIVSFQKGGLPVATKMANVLYWGSDFEVFNINKSKSTYALFEDYNRNHKLELSAYDTIIIVDDIVDSGDTINYYLNTVEDVLSAGKTVIIYTPFAKVKGLTSIDPNYRVIYSHLVPEDVWVDFPWEVCSYEYENYLEIEKA